MKHLICFFLLFGVCALNAQTNFTIPCGTTPNIDGVLDASEWLDADTTTIVKSATKEVTVYMKHDSTNLYFAFVGPLSSTSYYQYPEIILDIDNDKSETWDENDFWFHVSVQDCWGNGAPYNWSTCSPSHTNWIGTPNFSQTSSFVTDTVEMSFPYSTISLDNSINNDTIGIGFMMFHDTNLYKITPTTSNINDPSTWGSAIIQSCSMPVDTTTMPVDTTIMPVDTTTMPVDTTTMPIDTTTNTGINQWPIEEMKVYPNPSKYQISIDCANEIKEILILDLNGKQVLKSNSKVVDTSSIQNGIYFMIVRNQNNKMIKKKLVINK